jgi:UDP-N-acetyl-D-mannosaminuronic acid dehydrogenase
VDPWFIVDKTPDEARLIRTAREVNDDKPEWVLNKVRSALVKVSSDTGKPVHEITVACMGLTFKPDIDDLRESPALDIAHAVAGLGCRTVVAEPNIAQTPSSLQALGVDLCPAAQAAETADVVVWLVKHKPFFDLFSQFKEKNTVDAVGFNS